MVIPHVVGYAEAVHEDAIIVVSLNLSEDFALPITAPTAVIQVHQVPTPITVVDATGTSFRVVIEPALLDCVGIFAHPVIALDNRKPLTGWLASARRLTVAQSQSQSIVQDDETKTDSAKAVSVGT